MNFRKIIKQAIPTKLFSDLAPYLHWIEAIIAQAKDGFPAKNLKVVGVTGTDGKTTTCSLIASVLRAGGYRVAVITTAYIDYGDDKGEQINPTALTTGNVFALNKLIAKINKNNVDWLVLEVSSHALHQRRVWGVPFSMAVMTNMSNEHLDYHGTFDKYRQAKEMLFKQANKNKKGLRLGIINSDDKTSNYFVKDIKNTITYGLKRGNLQAKDIISDINGNRFDVKIDDKVISFKTQLLGKFNVYNSLAAIGVGIGAGMTNKQIQSGLFDLKNVNGRMMPLDEGQSFKVVIDYAVTPHALQNVIETTRDLVGNNKIHIVFGATGDRDKTKRPAMGDVTSRLADHVYLTNDETYSENPKSIREQVLSGVKKGYLSKVTEYDDRKKAIDSAIKIAKKDDIILITGIGHQNSINMGGKKITWSDTEVARESILSKLQK